MLLKGIRIPIALLCLLVIAIPISAAAKSAVGEVAVSTPTPPTGPFISIEINPTNLHIGETALVSVKLNNVPVEGYKSVEFTCSYDGTLVEKSNIAVTEGSCGSRFFIRRFAAFQKSIGSHHGAAQYKRNSR